MALVGDGAAANCRMFKILFPTYTFGNVNYPYKGPHPYIFGETLWALFDPSHLLKACPSHLSLALCE